MVPIWESRGRLNAKQESVLRCDLAAGKPVGARRGEGYDQRPPCDPQARGERQKSRDGDVRNELNLHATDFPVTVQVGIVPDHDVNRSDLRAGNEGYSGRPWGPGTEPTEARVVGSIGADAMLLPHWERSVFGDDTDAATWLEPRIDQGRLPDADACVQGKEYPRSDEAWAADR